MSLSATERLRRFYEPFCGSDRVLVLINADPDAIASAMAVKRLLWRKVACVTCASVNHVVRPDNKAMVRLLKFELLHIDEIDPSRFDRFVIVDSQPNHHEAFTRFTYDVIIDHHPDTGATARYTDIRPKYGATATIMTEYVKAARIKPSVRLSTGLFHAIRNDTNNFQRKALIEDVRAFQFHFRHANTHLANQIELGELRLDFLKYFQRALKGKKIRKGKLFAHIGNVSTPDVLVLIADFFMRIETVNSCFVSGIHDKKFIVIFRNDGYRKNAGKLAKQTFGQIGSAGGHKSVARAEVPLTELKGLISPKDDDAILRWMLNRIHKKAVK